VALCELVLMETYCLLRNPAVARKPLSADAAATAMQMLRRHRTWRMVDYVPNVADSLWIEAAKPGFAFRKIYDARIALTLRHHGVTELATRNISACGIPLISTSLTARACRTAASMAGTRKRPADAHPSTINHSPSTIPPSPFTIDPPFPLRYLRRTSP